MYESIPKRIWRIIYPPLILLGLIVLSYFIVLLTYISASADPFGADAFMSANNNYIAMGGALLGGVILYLFFYKRDFVISSKYLPENGRYFIAICAFGILAGHALSLLVSLLPLDGILGSYSRTEQSIFSDGVVATILQTVIVVPVAEEICFRGLVFNRTRKYAGFWISAIASGVLFGAYHLNLAQGVYALFFGILLCLVYEKFRNLWACIAMHAAANAVAVVLTLTGLSYPFGWLYILVMVICAAGAAGIYLGVIRKVEL